MSLLLQHVLSYSQDKTYQIQPFGDHIPKDRFFALLAKNDGLDVVFAGSSLEREHLYLAVHFPILRGLRGWRIPLVRRNNQDLFKDVHTLDSFKKLIPGQFHTWSDTQVLEANGITVTKGTDYEGLFGMLSKGRFDYFPRSILEVDSDYLNHKNLNIAIEPNIIIHYPTAYYFFVNKNNQVLANDLLAGLEAAHLDGSFNKLFMRYYGEQINKVLDTKRRIIQLQNPLLPKTTPLERSELWIRLDN
ncbi:hypothetical protein [Paraglaciecola sp.]|uniref:substrate-binding periplasmic protein n=1 Tax=Paraglaciecola sp. TaxID=1920173 RepID=UPI0030F3D3B1